MKFILNQWRELGPALFFVTIIVILIQAMGAALCLYILWRSWNTKPAFDLAIMAILFAIANAAPFFIWARPTSPKSVKIPEEAFSVGPDSYMKVWAVGERVHFVFKNMPMADISFDKKVAEELSRKLAEL
jgi:hypothetical protein